MILLLGSKGGMGRRYQSILRYLDIPFHGVDKDDAVPNLHYTGVLIATPTETHAELIWTYSALGLPILCEKPICKDEKELERLLSLHCNLTMVNQYAHLAYGSSTGSTYYDYWNSGRDGTQWDCINIIGLSKGKARLANKSPIWQCTINGQELKIQDMDKAYIRMIADWWKRPVENKEYIWKAHKKVLGQDYIYE